MAGEKQPPKAPTIAPQMRERTAARPAASHKEKAPEQASKHAGGAPADGLQGQLKVIVNEVPLLKPGGDPKDRELAARVLKAQHHLQEAMDAAVLAGLIVEPTFTSFPNRFKELGNDKDSFVAKIEIYRRLA